MTTTEVFEIVKHDLGELNPSAGRTNYLMTIMSAGINLMSDEGVNFDLENLDSEDCELIVMYTHYLVTKRDTSEGMPRMLRWALNNRILKEKANEI